jgi:YhcH/YjgK/YiaL family protein
MIVGLLANFPQEKGCFSPWLQKGLVFLETADFTQLPDGRHEVEGEDLYVMISTYIPQAKQLKKIESHEKYIDIQYVISGEEIMGYSNFSPATQVAENKLAECDAIFYRQAFHESDILVFAGMYVVFFPWDIHRPSCSSSPGVQVRKAVVKLRCQPN